MSSKNHRVSCCGRKIEEFEDILCCPRLQQLSVCLLLIKFIEIWNYWCRNKYLCRLKHLVKYYLCLSVVTLPIYGIEILRRWHRRLLFRKFDLMAYWGKLKMVFLGSNKSINSCSVLGTTVITEQKFSIFSLICLITSVVKTSKALKEDHFVVFYFGSPNTSHFGKTAYE